MVKYRGITDSGNNDIPVEAPEIELTENQKLLKEKCPDGKWTCKCGTVNGIEYEECQKMFCFRTRNGVLGLK